MPYCLRLTFFNTLSCDPDDKFKTKYLITFNIWSLIYVKTDFTLPFGEWDIQPSNGRGRHFCYFKVSLYFYTSMTYCKRWIIQHSKENTLINGYCSEFSKCRFGSFGNKTRIMNTVFKMLACVDLPLRTNIYIILKIIDSKLICLKYKYALIKD